MRVSLFARNPVQSVALGEDFFGAAHGNGVGGGDPVNPTAVPRSPQSSHCFGSIALKDLDDFCRT